MDTGNKYLEKITIRANDNLVQEFKPIIVQSTCRITSAERYFEQVPSWTILKNKSYKETVKLLYNSFTTKYRFKKHKPYTVAMNNVNIKLYKNSFYNQYIVFLVKNKENTDQPNTVYFEIGDKFRQKFIPKVANHSKNKKRKKPKNFSEIIPLNNIFEHSVKNRLKKCLATQDSYISASAIFKTDMEVAPKMFVSIDINNKSDIHNFLYEIKRINTDNELIMNHNINLENVHAFIVINKYKTNLYVPVNTEIKSNRRQIKSNIIKFNDKKYLNANILFKSNLLTVKYLKNQKVVTQSSINRDVYSCVNRIDVKQYSPNKIIELIEKYEENIHNYIPSEPMDEFMKESYKILVELQLKAIEQCNQTYYNYFTRKNYTSKLHILNYHQEIYNNYYNLINLQNKAVQNSVNVSQQISKANKFLEKVWSQTKKCRSQSNFLTKNKIILPAKSMSVQAINMENDKNNFYFLKFKSQNHESGFGNVQKIVKKVLTMDKCCSPLILQEFDKKSTQTDISVNKNTSIEFGGVGKQVQICRRNIMLKIDNKKLKTGNKDLEKLKLTLTASEKKILENIGLNRRECTPKLTQIYPQNPEPEPNLKNDPKKYFDGSNTEITNENEKLDTNMNDIGDKTDITDENEKLDDILQDMDDNKTENPKNRELLQQIKNTLQMVKEKFDKNSVILKKASDLKNNYIVTTNIKKLMQSNFPGRPKFVKASNKELQGFSSTCTVQSTKDAITMNLNNSLQLLKNLNEVTKNIKVSPDNAMTKLTDINDNIQLQKRLKLEKMDVTLTPIKNFIASNKLKVSNNALRVQPSKPDVPRTKQAIDETQTFVKPKKTKKVSIKSDDTPKPPRNPLTVESVVVPCPPKIYRPVNTYASKELPDAPKLSDLTLQDVAPLSPEYPRKDDLYPVDVRKSYLYKLLNNSFSEVSLEPLIKCTDTACTSCVGVCGEKKGGKRFKKESNQKVREYVWEKMDWNTGITVQNTHSFDFQKYMQDPNYKNNQDVLAYPVFTDTDKKKPESAKLPPLQKNIQRSIQQSLIRNQEKYKFVQHSPMTKATGNRVPKISSSGIMPVKKNPKKNTNSPPKKNDDMQKYIQLVEQKFLKTFSLPETEKATAYNNLETEIKEMLSLLNNNKNKQTNEQVSNLTSLSKKCDLEISKKLPQKNNKKINQNPSNTSVIVIKKPQTIFTQTTEMTVKKKNSDIAKPTACSCNLFDSLTSLVTKTNTFPSASILKKQSNTSVISTPSVKNKKVRFADEKSKSNSSISLTTDEEYSTMYEETVSDFSSDQELSKMLKPYTDIAIWIEVKFFTQTVFPITTTQSYQLTQWYQQCKLFDLVPENYELQIFSDTNSSFQLTERDSLSDFIDNCEEIIQSTKYYDVKVNESVNILEFLNVITNLSIDNMSICSCIYYKQNITYICNTYTQKIYSLITYHCQIIYFLSHSQLELNRSIKQINEIAKELELTVKEFQHNPKLSNFTNTQTISQELHDTVTEMNTSNTGICKIVTELQENVHEIEKNTKNRDIHKLICQIKQTAQELPTEGSHQLQKFNFPRLNLEKHLSEPILSNEFFQYHLSMPRILKCPSDLADRNQLNILSYKSKKRYDDICQTVVFNLQLHGKNHRKSICKKRYACPLKNRIQIRNIKMDNTETKLIYIAHSHKVLLIFFYITLFSVLFLCLTINYKCH